MDQMHVLLAIVYQRLATSGHWNDAAKFFDHSVDSTVLRGICNPNTFLQTWQFDFGCFFWWALCGWCKDPLLHAIPMWIFHLAHRETWLGRAKKRDAAQQKSDSLALCWWALGRHFSKLSIGEDDHIPILPYTRDHCLRGDPKAQGFQSTGPQTTHEVLADGSILMASLYNLGHVGFLTINTSGAYGKLLVMKNCQKGLVDSTCIPKEILRICKYACVCRAFWEHQRVINVIFPVLCLDFPFAICVVFILGTSGNTFHPTFLAHREHFTNDFHQRTFGLGLEAGWVVPDVTLIISMRYINTENCLTMMCLVWDLMQLQVRSSVPTATWWIVFFVNNFFSMWLLWNGTSSHLYMGDF